MKSPSAHRSACSRPEPPCAPASPTACWPRPTTNSPNSRACAPPKISRKASKPPPSAASRISEGGEFSSLLPLWEKAILAKRGSDEGSPCAETEFAERYPSPVRDASHRVHPLPQG